MHDVSHLASAFLELVEVRWVNGRATTRHAFTQLSSYSKEKKKKKIGKRQADSIPETTYGPWPRSAGLITARLYRSQMWADDCLLFLREIAWTNPVKKSCKRWICKKAPDNVLTFIMLFEIKQSLHFNSDICTNTCSTGLFIVIGCTLTINLKQNFFLYSQKKKKKLRWFQSFFSAAA